MTAALITLALAQPLTAFFAFRYLAKRGEAERAERETLVQRIQDPVAAVATHAALAVGAQTPAAQQPSHLPFDDDAAWLEYQLGFAQGDDN